MREANGAGGATRCTAAVVSADGGSLWRGFGGGGIERYSTADGTRRARLDGHAGAVRALRLDAAGRRLLSASADGTLRVWDAGSGAPLLTLEAEAAVIDAAFLADGRRVLSCGADGAARVWSLDDGRRSATIAIEGDTPTCCVGAPDADGIAVGTASGAILIGAPDDGRALQPLARLDGEVLALAAGPEGWLLAASAGQLWTSEGEIPGLGCACGDGCGGAIGCVGLSADGRRGVLGYADGMLRGFAPGSGRAENEAARALDGPVVACAPLADGRTLAVGVDGRAVWVDAAGRVARCVDGVGASADDDGPQVDEDVQFTVYRPRRVPAERWVPLLVFAHHAERPADAPDDEPDPIAEVRRQATETLGDAVDDYRDVVEDAAAAVPRDGELRVVPTVDSVRFDPPWQAFPWTGAVHRERFRMRADAETAGTTVRGHVMVFLGAVLLAEVGVAIPVSEAGASLETEAGEPLERAGVGQRFRRIFASYAHRDRAVVASVQAAYRALGDEFLRDVTHLRSGEAWEERLRAMIRDADLFQLFWSREAMASPFVREEYEYALSLGRERFVRPVFWEDPFPEDPSRQLPPPELRRLHFARLALGEGSEDPGPRLAPPLPRPAPDPPVPVPRPAPPPPRPAPDPPAPVPRPAPPPPRPAPDPPVAVPRPAPPDVPDRGPVALGQGDDVGAVPNRQLEGRASGGDRRKRGGRTLRRVLVAATLMLVAGLPLYVWMQMGESAGLDDDDVVVHPPDGDDDQATPFPPVAIVSLDSPVALPGQTLRFQVGDAPAGMHRRWVVEGCGTLETVGDVGELELVLPDGCAVGDELEVRVELMPRGGLAPVATDSQVIRVGRPEVRERPRAEREPPLEVRDPAVERREPAKRGAGGR